MKLNKILIGLVLLFSCGASAQNSHDFVLNEARSYFEKKDYSKAEILLESILRKNPENMYATWLMAQVAMADKNRDYSEKLFQRALRLDPGNKELQLDYARTMLISKHLNAAEKEYLKVTDSSFSKDEQLEANMMLAYIYYWKLSYKKAEMYADRVLQLDNENVQAKDFKMLLEQTTAPYVNLNVDYASDDQPLNVYTEKVEFGLSKGSYLNPNLRLSNRNFNTHKQVITAELSNTSHFRTGTSLTLSAGVYRNLSAGTNFIGEAVIKQKLYEGLYLTGGINRLPYLNTRVSTDMCFLENNAYGILGYDNSKLFQINVLYQYKFLKGDNNIKTVGGWIVSRPLNFSLFEFKAGYGYSYSDSKEMMYRPDGNLAEMESDPLTGKIAGTYDPYFTPKNQSIHSVIGSLKLKFTPNLWVMGSGSYGFYATNRSPLLFREQLPNGQYNSILAYYTQKNHPFDVKAIVNYDISSQFTLGAYYQRQETEFYAQNKVGINLLYKFR